MRSSFSIVTVLILLISGFAACHKENIVGANDIEGKWELRKIIGSWSTTNYQPGNGNTISFDGDRYIISQNGQITSGSFIIVTDPTVSESTCSIIPAEQYTNRIIFDNNSNGQKTFFELSENKLTLLTGCLAVDARSFSEYERQ